MVLTDTLLELFLETRSTSEQICAPLETEDYVVQPVADVSPPKWHLGHTTWFFEEFILKPYTPGYKLFDESFSFVFNSYYETVGKRVVRANRGNLSRPSVTKIYEYRNYVTNAISVFWQKGRIDKEIAAVLEIGIHHEKQHQELLITDIKFILGHNPLLPAYGNAIEAHEKEETFPEFITIEEGLYTIGHTDASFCYDNEMGAHKVFVNEYQISNSLVTNGDYIDFINDGGYSNFEYWHAEGLDWVKQHQVKAPMYWHFIDDEWHHYTLSGLQKIDKETPLTHISYYEAFAFAQWKGLRLPTEFEWEIASGLFEWGKRWEWTESAYLPYPNYKKPTGALGEYNGKFMVSQKVLRGGSIATPEKHTRNTYRNFFHPSQRWQFTGIRLAK
ncbi:ergothioneine biosynthesis protein EgtB [Neptunitalea lumnitzerae]|uniref:Ergothioneine biosynthesis protein EgtB n=1 Tax=Neptunitalea lumnitzerae TaxID=2965509 RepID=A0ABQ5MI07_9FLAO|nr:ergothioneine biosynthesis protein EgtB [Neptunitalea sp. Y10]GLB49015.1 ergothioneine biosynthesis protein EgtB [Neptunitalea sp. Y10]